ncbi:MAG: nitrous oxide reductase accessory protein NosL [Campylobacterota bacterium]|nr:nitrous oxide reductase accessory protein NosL [Campylobacterota bacterium]
MKKIMVVLLVLSSLVYGVSSNEGKANSHAKKQKKMFQSVSMDKATILQKGKAKMFCPTCGMTLPMFYKTNHAANHNAKTEQYCSIHCLAEENIKNSANLKDIKVVDVTSLKFIDATKATYVVGSSKKGTMSMKSKYAFADKKDAEKFSKEFGGKVMSFEGAYKVASKGLEKEMKMVAKKQAKMAKMGKKIYNKMCKKTDLKFNSTAEAKAFVKSSKICGDMKGKKLQAVGIYLGRR